MSGKNPSLSEDAPQTFNVWRILPWLIILFVGIRRLIRAQHDSIMWSALAVGTCGLAFEIWLALRRRAEAKQRLAAEEEDEDDTPIRSLVFLLEDPREIKPNGPWVKQLADAVGQPLNAEGEKSTAFVMPMPHPSIPPEDGDCFMLKIREGAFWIFNIHKPYVEDPQEFSEKIADARLRTAIARHKAWISVDLLHWSGLYDQDAVYAVIGKSLAALAGPDVVAVLCPELNRCNEFDMSLIPGLAGGTPLGIFKHSTFAPVISISDTDEQMEAAKEEARRRWPEFVALFQKRDPASERPFIVKAPFSDKNHEEFMWVEVTGLDGNLLTGILSNTPHRLTGFHEGQTVTIPADSVIDWLCIGPDEKPLGGWTQKVITRSNSA